jgi:hypothetical protein
MDSSVLAVLMVFEQNLAWSASWILQWMEEEVALQPF